MARILKAGDSWALSNAEGFKPSLLPSWLLDPNGTAPEINEPEPVAVVPAAVIKAVAPQTNNCPDGKCNVNTYQPIRRFFR